MAIKVLIIDDEPIALEKLRNYVAKIPFFELVAACETAFDAVEVISCNKVDAIFTDVDMPGLSGMEFITSLSVRPMVVFITAHANYAAESYRLSAVDYILKPYGFVDFQRAANKIMERYAATRRGDSMTQFERPDSLFVKTDYRYVRVALSDIKYIKGYGEYLQIYIDGEAEPLMTLSSFSAIKEKLTDDFLQVHRSYMVNMNQVSQIERSRIVFYPDTYIPVGDVYKNDLQQYLSDHAVGRTGKKD